MERDLTARGRAPGVPCPVCDATELTSPPYETWPAPDDLELQPPYENVLGSPSYEVCPNCGFEFGNDDTPGTAAPVSFEQYRNQWTADGSPRFDSAHLLVVDDTFELTGRPGLTLTPHVSREIEPGDYQVIAISPDGRRMSTTANLSSVHFNPEAFNSSVACPDSPRATSRRVRESGSIDTRTSDQELRTPESSPQPPLAVPHGEAKQQRLRYRRSPAVYGHHLGCPIIPPHRSRHAPPKSRTGTRNIGVR